MGLKMDLILYFIFVLSVDSANILSPPINSSALVNSSNPYEILAPFENDFTPETFAFFNVSKKYKKFDLTEMEHLSRRWALWWYALFAPEHSYSSEHNTRACFLMCITYLSALPEIRKYFHIRYLYVNNLEYEVGYLTYDIVYRYQMMIEIYQIVHEKYYMHPWGYKAHITYMFYMYRNMLEYSMTIIHLCNMMHELEAKYKYSSIGVWDDYPESEEKKKVKETNHTKEHKESVKDYMKRREEEQKRRRKQRKKERKQINYENYKLTTPQRRPKKSFWPLHYGWSIEYW